MTVGFLFLFGARWSKLHVHGDACFRSASEMGRPFGGDTKGTGKFQGGVKVGGEEKRIEEACWLC